MILVLLLSIPFPFRAQVVQTLRVSTLREAAWAMRQSPVTVTASRCPRSAGGPHDFYSEADYFWPNPKSPDSAYIEKDGQTDPGNFNDHRLAMIRLSRIIGALASAYALTGDDRYVRQALLHARAWFARYIEWLMTSAPGKTEMSALNNHGTCWVMQVAAFARFTGNDSVLNFCRNRYKMVLLPGQMAADGSFPLELKRTKPYGYSIFNLDAMTAVCQLLSVPDDDLWHYSTPDGRSIQKGIAFLYPYITAKDKWPYAHDVMHWEEWPVAQPFLVFGANAFDRGDWLRTWEGLDHQPAGQEVVRNLPVRHPLIWFLTGDLFGG